MAWLWSTRTFVGTIIIDTETGWWFQPLRKYESQLGLLFPIYGQSQNSCSKPPIRRRFEKHTKSNSQKPLMMGPRFPEKTAPGHGKHIDFGRARVQSLELFKKRLQKVLDWLQSVFEKKHRFPMDLVWILCRFQNHHGSSWTSQWEREKSCSKRRRYGGTCLRTSSVASTTSCLS